MKLNEKHRIDILIMIGFEGKSRIQMEVKNIQNEKQFCNSPLAKWERIQKTGHVRDLLEDSRQQVVKVNFSDEATFLNGHINRQTSVLGYEKSTLNAGEINSMGGNNT